MLVCGFGAGAVIGCFCVWMVVFVALICCFLVCCFCVFFVVGFGFFAGF